MLSHVLRVPLLTLLAATALQTGCANREYVTQRVMFDIHRQDPKYSKIRLYSSATFIAVYIKELGDDYSVSGQVGNLREDIRGQRIEVEIKRKAPGAIVGVDMNEESPILWVAFDKRCRTQSCAFGFIYGDDGLFRLFHVPALPGFGEPFLYRKRMVPRKTMEKTKIYSSAKGAPVYFTMRGMAASIALEVKKRKRIDVEVIRDAPGGVQPGADAK